MSSPNYCQPWGDPGEIDRRAEKRMLRRHGVETPLEIAYRRGQAAPEHRPNPYPAGRRHDEFERGRRSADR